MIEVLAHAIPVARIELCDDVQIDAVNRHFDLDLDGRADALPRVPRHPRRDRRRRPPRPSAIAEGHGVLGFDWAADEAERRALWHARHGAYEAAPALRPGTQGFTTDACVPISNARRVHHRDQAATSTPPACSRRSSATSATATSTWRSSSTPTTRRSSQRARQLNDRLVRRAIAYDGTCTGEHGVGYGKSAFLELEHGAARAGDDARDQVRFGSQTTCSIRERSPKAEIQE